MNPQAPHPIEINCLAFAHSGEPVLENVSLTVEQGEFLALIGPNGGGKTTLLRLVLGLLTPDAGTVRVFGREPSTMSARMGYVPQFSTLRSDFPASVLDMVLMGAARPGLLGGGWRTGKAEKETALSHLETLGLTDMAQHPVGGLSGGQRQRALVARALMGRPADARIPFLLLLDEPTASIDPQGKFCFYEFMGKLRGSVTILVVSHDLFIASPFFSHIAFINRTITPLPDTRLTPETLSRLFGTHLHECPVADLQHAGGVQHAEGCSHPACSHPEGLRPPQFTTARDFFGER